MSLYNINSVPGTLGNVTFQIGDVLALKNFDVELVEGSRLKITSTQNANFCLLEADVSEVEIDGVVHTDPTTAQNALKALVFNPQQPQIIDAQTLANLIQKTPNVTDRVILADGSLAEFYNKTDADNTFLSKPTQTATTTEAPFVVGVNGENESYKLPAGDLGKNIGNTDLQIPRGTVRTLDVTGADIAFKGLKSAQGDASFNKRPKMKADGTWGQVDENIMVKEDLKKAPTLLDDREKERWRTEMNGGWTTNSMSVVLINPMVLKNKSEWQFVSLTGANLNFKPTNFKIEICTGDSTASNTNVVTTIDNSKVQLINGQTLGFWLNVVESNLSNGDYKIRLSNGIATYLTPMVFKVLEPSQIKPLVFTNSQSVLLQSGNSTFQVVNSAKDVILSPDASIKALANVNGKDIVAQFQTDRVLKGSENWCFELVVNTQQMQNGALISSYFGLSSAEDSSTIINTLDFEFSIGKTSWNGSNFIRGLGIVINETNPTLRFLKYQNLLIVVVSSSDGRYNSVASRSINTDTDYRLVFSKNNCGSVNDKTGFFITNEYKF